MSRFHRRRNVCLATPVRALLLTGALVVFATVALTSMVRAQEAGTMVIEVPPAQALGVASWADFGIDRLIVFAGDEVCADVAIPAEGDVEIVLGAQDQPASCAAPGTEVLFVNGLGQWLAASTAFTAGESFVLDELLAPRPPGTPYPEFICAFLDDEGIEVTACQAIGPPGGAGTIAWSFAPRGVFADQRVITAFVLLVDGDAVVASHPDAAVLAYAHPDDFLAEATDAEAPLLLMAAGIMDADGAVQLEQGRPCAIWTPHDASGEAPLMGVATALGAELARVFETLGLAIPPCEVTADLAAADILLWRDGQDAEPAAPEGASFLVSPVPTGPADPPHGNRGGDAGAPAPGAAGHGPPGLVDPAHLSALDLVAILVALALAVAVARGATGRTRA